MSKLQTQLINFQNTNLHTARDEHGIIYVALKPMVISMGLTWQSQHEKVRTDSRYNAIVIPYQTNGGIQEMLSLSLDHLPAYLYSINPNRVKKELRATIIAFQSETFAVINAYWRNSTVEAELGTHEKSVPHVISGYKGKIAAMQNTIDDLKHQNKYLKEHTAIYIKGIKKLHKRIEAQELMLPRKVAKNNPVSLMQKGLAYDEVLNSYAVSNILLSELNALPLPEGVHPKVYENGVMPHIRKRLTSLSKGIEKELGLVGKRYIKELDLLGLYFLAPTLCSNTTIFGEDYTHYDHERDKDLPKAIWMHHAQLNSTDKYPDGPDYSSDFS